LGTTYVCMIHFNTKEELIAELEVIPDERWCMGSYVNGETCCVLGHLGMVSRYDPQYDDNVHMSLIKKLNRIIPRWNFCTLYHVNDNHNPNFPQSTPKARVLAYLKTL